VGKERKRRRRKVSYPLLPPLPSLFLSAIVQKGLMEERREKKSSSPLFFFYPAARVHRSRGEREKVFKFPPGPPGDQERREEKKNGKVIISLLLPTRG